MKSSILLRTAIGLTIAALPAAVLAQPWSPATEVIGQPIQVTTNGTTNTLYLDPGGQLRIMTPNGNTVPGSWSAANGQLCISAGGPQECVPYTNPFQAGIAKDLTSSCGAVERWLAENTNQMPTQGEKGERGR